MVAMVPSLRPVNGMRLRPGRRKLGLSPSGSRSKDRPLHKLRASRWKRKNPLAWLAAGGKRKKWRASQPVVNPPWPWGACQSKAGRRPSGRHRFGERFNRKDNGAAGKAVEWLPPTKAAVRQLGW